MLDYPLSCRPLSILPACIDRIQRRPSRLWTGRVVEAIGPAVRSEGPFCRIGECCEIVDRSGLTEEAEVIGFRGSQVLSMPLRSSAELRYGSIVRALGTAPGIPTGDALLGRVLNASGRPLDGGSPLSADAFWPLDRPPLDPMDRPPISEPITIGVRAIDGLLTVGCGQRVGIFGGSGVGKSTLIGMMTRNTSADVIVVGLIGERGREVREFLDNVLGEDGRRRSVVIVSTSDESPLLRIRAAMATTTVAESFAASGKNVLLVIDSLTRFAMAQRELGLAAGEPPTVKGYTPSVFSKLARLVERAGRFRRGSITAFYTVLMEGDDQQDPIVDTIRSLIDGHIVLSRLLAAEGQYPPIAVLDSISRLMPAITDGLHLRQAASVRRLLATYGHAEDLVRIGAYKAGSDPAVDHSLRMMPSLRRFLSQTADEQPTLPQTLEALAEFATEPLK